MKFYGTWLPYAIFSFVARIADLWAQKNWRSAFNVVKYLYWLRYCAVSLLIRYCCSNESNKFCIVIQPLSITQTRKRKKEIDLDLPKFQSTSSRIFSAVAWNPSHFHQVPQASQQKHRCRIHGDFEVPKPTRYWLRAKLWKAVKVIRLYRLERCLSCE